MLLKEYFLFRQCDRKLEEFSPIAQSIYLGQSLYFLRLTGFHFAWLPFSEFIQISRRVAWGFPEAIIIIFAMNLSMKLRQFYEQLNLSRYQIVFDSYWRKMRERYVMLCELIEMANEFFGPLLIATTFLDFFFLCERIYKLLS